MSFRKLLRGLSTLLVLAGLSVLVYACASYVQAQQVEKQAEARVPGQGPEKAQIVLPTLTPPDTATPSRQSEASGIGGDDDASDGMSTATSTPTEPPPPSEPPTATSVPTQPSTAPLVVGSDGLPRGQGADPVRIVIPRMQLDVPVREATWDVVNQNNVQVSEWQIPYDAVGHLATTAKPGEQGNAVISGHNNLIAPNVFGVGLFAGLWNLQINDPIYITDALGRTFLFQVSTFYHVQELGEPDSIRMEHYQQMIADDGTPIITLETCWNGDQAPLSGNTYRWIVQARLIGTVDGSQIPSVKR
jgi:sortase (surface protein transpeptidase)